MHQYPGFNGDANRPNADSEVIHQGIQRSVIFEEQGTLRSSWTDSNTRLKHHHFQQFDLNYEWKKLPAVPAGSWESLPEDIRGSVRSFFEPIYTHVPSSLSPVFQGFVSTSVEALSRSVAIEYHKPLSERYILRAANVNEFLWDYFRRFFAILSPNCPPEDNPFFTRQRGIECREGRDFIYNPFFTQEQGGQGTGWYNPRIPEPSNKYFWSREVTASTNHQTTLKYLEDIVLYLLTLKFVNPEDVERSVRATVLRSTHRSGWVPINQSVHEIVQNPQRITRSHSLS